MIKPIRRVIRIAFGCVFIVLGLIGLALPIIPQVPFFIFGAILLAPFVPAVQRLIVHLHEKHPQSRVITRWCKKYVGLSIEPEIRASANIPLEKRPAPDQPPAKEEKRNHE